MRELVTVDPHSKFMAEVLAKDIVAESIQWRKKRRNQYILSAFMFIAGIVIFYGYLLRELTMEVAFGGIIGVEAVSLFFLYKAMTNRFVPDIQGAGIVYIPIQQITTFSGQMLLDRSGLLDKETMVLNSPDAVKQAVSLLEKLKETIDDLPVIMDKTPCVEFETDDGIPQTLHGIELELIDSVEQIIRTLDEAVPYSVDVGSAKSFLPFCLVERESNFQPAWPIVNEIDDTQNQNLEWYIHTVQSGINSWFSMIKKLDSLGSDSNEIFNTITSSTEASLNKIIPDYHSSLSVLSDTLSFNYYCFDCNKGVLEDISNLSPGYDGSEQNSPRLDPATKLIYDQNLENWCCPLCAKVCDVPIFVHRVLDEVLLPTFDLLLQENRVERQKIYNGILDQKLDYKNQWEKELEQVFTRNRDSIQSISAKMRSIRSELKSAMSSYTAFNEIIKQIEIIGRTRANEIEMNYEQQTRAIIDSNEKFQSEQKEFVDNLRENLQNDVNKFAKVAAEEREAEMEILNSIRQSTERTANATEQSVEIQQQQLETQKGMAEDIADIKESNREMEAIEKARARESGLDKGRGPTAFITNWKHSWEDGVASLMGESAVDQHRRN